MYSYLRCVSDFLQFVDVKDTDLSSVKEWFA